MVITKVEKLMRNGERVNDTLRCTIDGQICFVPEDPANTDYARILSMINAGSISIEETIIK